MNQKKINPSESDLRKSILDSISEKLNLEIPREEDFENTEWVNAKQMAKYQNISIDASTKRLRRSHQRGELEMKTIMCRCGNATAKVNFYKIADEITRAY